MFKFLDSICNKIHPFACIIKSTIHVKSSTFKSSENPKSYFQAESLAKDYKKFREDMPEGVVDKIVQFVSQKFEPAQCIVVDVGCGSGQSTLPLAPYFKKIYAYDTSIAQIKEFQRTPNQAPNVQFQTADAESLPLPDSSVHLVSAMLSVHWFDIEAFLKEVDRILVPNGVLALVVASRDTKIKGFEDKTTVLFRKLMEDTDRFYDERVQLVNNFYRDIQIPYEECIRDQSVTTAKEVSIAFIIGRLKTSSGIARYIREKPDEAEKVLESYKNSLLEIVGSTKSAEETKVTFLRQYTVVLARKPGHKR